MLSASKKMRSSSWRCFHLATSVSKRLRLMRLSLLGVPDEIVIDFHMHDLVRGDWHRRSGVPWSARLGYARAQSMGEPARAFEAVARYFVRKGYRPEALSYLSPKFGEFPTPDDGRLFRKKGRSAE